MKREILPSTRGTHAAMSRARVSPLVCLASSTLLLFCAPSYSTTLASPTPSVPPELGQPFELERARVGRYAPRDQCKPAVASDGNGYLAVWSDKRSGSYDIYGARIDSCGRVLDVGGILISAEVGDQNDPSVAFDGNNYFVVWSDGRSGPYDIYGARVTPEGVILDPDGIPISRACGDQVTPAVAFGNTSYLIVWSDSRVVDSDVYGARVNPSGAVLDPAGFPIWIDFYTTENPTLAFDGTNYLVAWETRTYSLVAALRVTAAGNIIDRSPLMFSSCPEGLWGRQHSPVLTFDGTNYLGGWVVGGGVICVGRISKALEIIDSAPIVLSARRPAASLSLVFDGAEHVAVWAENRGGQSYDIYAARVTPSGQLVDPLGLLVSATPTSETGPAIAACGRNCLAIWEDGRNDTCDVYGTRVEFPEGVLDRSGLLISTEANNQTSPQAASNGSDYLVVWKDLRTPKGDIFGALVSSSGTVSDSGAIAIAATGAAEANPIAASDGTSYLVVWESEGLGASRDILGIRLNTDGSLADTCAMAISAAPGYQCTPALSFDGRNYMTVWCDNRNGTLDIYGTRVDPAGMVLDPEGIAISRGACFERDPAIGFDGETYLVVWQDWRSGTGADIYGARLDRDGRVLDKNGFAVCAEPGNQSSPAVTWDGRRFLVVWVNEEDCAFPGVCSARMNKQGTILDRGGVMVSAGTMKRKPRAAFDGTDYFIVWEEFDNRPFARAARVNLDGKVIDPDGIQVDDGHTSVEVPSVCAGPQACLLVTFDCSPAPPAYPMHRIWGRMWEGPVCFASLSASARHGFAELSWSMLSEAGEADFVVERSTSIPKDFQVQNLAVTRTGTHTFSCTDRDVVQGQTYWYRVVLQTETRRECYGPVEVQVDILPEACWSSPANPNPLSSFTSVTFGLSHTGRVGFYIFNVAGRLVRIVVDEERPPGTYQENWNAEDSEGRRVPSGVYFFRLRMGETEHAGKIVVLH
ncbi:MAG: hypothetical protein V2A71_03700 [Candidatus Eisenbacteria bacterium]